MVSRRRVAGGAGPSAASPLACIPPVFGASPLLASGPAALRHARSVYARKAPSRSCFFPRPLAGAGTRPRTTCSRTPCLRNHSGNVCSPCTSPSTRPWWAGAGAHSSSASTPARRPCAALAQAGIDVRGLDLDAMLARVHSLARTSKVSLTPKERVAFTARRELCA